MSRYTEKVGKAKAFAFNGTDAIASLLHMLEDSEREILRLEKIYDKLEAEYEEVVAQLSEYQADIADTIRENGGIA